MQKDEQLQSEQNPLENAQKYLEETATVTRESDINEEFYTIRAINENGLPVEIIGVDSAVSYQPYLATNTERGRVNTHSGEVVENINSDYFTNYEDTTVLYFSTKIVIDINIYYKTPYNQIYEISFNDKRGHYRSGFADSINFLSQLLKEIEYSDGIHTVSDISNLNSITASIHPNETLTDGEIEINNEKAQLKECEKVEVAKTASENVDKHIRFVTGKNYEKCVQHDDKYLNDWIWGYISDVRGDVENDTVVLTVETPLGTAVFPYKLLHDTKTPFWELIKEKGGNLTSLRGEDVCIRKRAGYNILYDVYDIRDCGFNSHEYPEFGKKVTNQPIPSPRDRDCPLIINEPNDVEPVGVSSDYAWVLGIPPTERFVEDKTNEKEESESSESTNNKSILGKVQELF